MCYINNYPKTTSEENCRSTLDTFLKHSTNTSQPALQVVFSHVPLNKLSPASNTNGPSMVSVKSRILSSLHGARYVFSGHIHHTMYNRHDVDMSQTTTEAGSHRVMSHGLPQSEYGNARHPVHEITVPTCSYRMGEKHMGIGAAVLSEFKRVYCMYSYCNSGTFNKGHSQEEDSCTININYLSTAKDMHFSMYQNCRLSLFSLKRGQPLY